MAAKAYLEQYLECKLVAVAMCTSCTECDYVTGMDSMPLDLQRVVSQLWELDRQTQGIIGAGTRRRVIVSVCLYPSRLLYCRATTTLTTGQRTMQVVRKAIKCISRRTATVVSTVVSTDGDRSPCW